MNHLDLLNGTFESVGAFLVWRDVVQLRSDKEVKGLDWRTTAFFVAWGISGLFYYGSLGHWLSLSAGVALVLGRAVWVAHAIHYKNNPPQLGAVVRLVRKRS